MSIFFLGMTVHHISWEGGRYLIYFTNWGITLTALAYTALGLSDLINSYRDPLTKVSVLLFEMSLSFEINIVIFFWAMLASQVPVLDA